VAAMKYTACCVIITAVCVTLISSIRMASGQAVSAQGPAVSDTVHIYPEPEK